MNHTSRSTLMGRLYTKLSYPFHYIRSNPFLQGGVIYLLGLGVDKGIAFLSVSIFAYLLTPAEFGRIAVFTSWHGIFLIVLNLNIKASIYNAHSEFGNEQLDGFASSILTLGMLTSIAASLLILIIPSSIANVIFGLKKTWILVGLVSATFGFPILIAIDVWRTRKQAVLFSIYTILSTAFAILLSIVFILFFQYFHQLDPALGRVLGIAVAHTLLGIYFLIRRLSAGKTFFRVAYWKYALRLSLPMVAYALSFVLLSRSDQMLIQLMIGDYETGLYSIVYRLGELSLIVFYGTDSLWTVWVFEQLRQENYAAIRKRAHQYMLFFAIATIGLMIIGPFLLRLITPDIYWEAARLVPLVITSGFLFMLYSIAGSIELYYKKTQYIAFSTGIATIINIILNIILLPVYGYEVAAVTTVAAYLLLFLINTLFVHRKLKRGDLYNWIFATSLAVILMCFAALLYIVDIG